jgi:CRISPR-associated endonuclease/helicase Cas3
MRYYQLLYSEIDECYQDFGVQKGKRRLTLLSLLSDNSSFYDEDSPFAGQFQLNQAFQLAGSLFKVFDQDTTDVIVPYREGKQLIIELGSIDFQRQPQRLAQVLEAAKPYTVSLYVYQRKRMENEGALVSMCGGSVLVLQEGHYDDDTGLVTQSGEKSYLEV